MAIQTTCAGCGKQLSVADEHAGKKARCPACSTIFTVHAQAAPQQANPFQLGQGYQPGTGEYPYAVGNTDSPSVESLSTSPAPDEMFWMRASDGNIYGPTDREKLNRWFSEGRVGVGYQIRQGDGGLWEDAAIFRPETSAAARPGGPASNNPYAPQSGLGNAAATGTPLHKYPKADRGVIVLVMGILSFAICFIFGIVAVGMGKAAMNDINAGLANPNDKLLVQIGFWLGVANLIVHVVGIGFFLLIAALSAVNQF